MAKTSKKNKARIKSKRRFFIFGLSSIAIIITLVVTIGNYWVEIYRIYCEKAELEKELLKLEKEEAILRVDVEKMKDPEYVAKYAREKYLYSKDGEIIIRIP